jgi:hypothetical protein
MPDVVLILGSGPNVVQSTQWSRAWFDRIVAINNAWRVRADWDDLIYPEDFPEDRRPDLIPAGRRVIEASDFVPAQNRFGGFVYAGGTMAFTAGYWALHALRPRVMAFLGCDMVYPATGPTHYYGTGTADPLRPDVTLQDLGAKSARLGMLAAAQGCACVNLSQDDSTLLFPRAEPNDLSGLKPPVVQSVGKVLMEEAKLGYFVPSGRYWEAEDSFDSAALARVDVLWRSAYRDTLRRTETARAA